LELLPVAGRPAIDATFLVAITFPSLPGRFLSAKAKAAGVPADKRRALLARGQCVTLDDGTVIDPLVSGIVGPATHVPPVLLAVSHLAWPGGPAQSIAASPTQSQSQSQSTLLSSSPQRLCDALASAIADHLDGMALLREQPKSCCPVLLFGDESFVSTTSQALSAAASSATSGVGPDRPAVPLVVEAF
jgi:hypothetical protein